MEHEIPQGQFIRNLMLRDGFYLNCVCIKFIREVHAAYIGHFKFYRRKTPRKDYIIAYLSEESKSHICVE